MADDETLAFPPPTTKRGFVRRPIPPGRPDPDERWTTEANAYLTHEVPEEEYEGRIVQLDHWLFRHCEGPFKLTVTKGMLELEVDEANPHPDDIPASLAKGDPPVIFEGTALIRFTNPDDSVVAVLNLADGNPPEPTNIEGPRCGGGCWGGFAEDPC